VAPDSLQIDPMGEALTALRLPTIERTLMFHSATARDCLIEVEGEAPRRLRAGALALVPLGAG